MTGTGTERGIFLGLDAGTTAMKAGAYDAAGRLLAEARVPVPVLRPRDGWVEQDMDAVWQAARTCLADVIGRIDAPGVRAIGLAGQGDGLWMLDADRRPVRPAILWNDTRADGLVAGWIADGTSDRLSRHARTANWPGTAGSAFAWLMRHEPEAVTRSRHIMWCKDWLTFRLSGTLGTDFSDATIPFLDLERRAWAPSAFAALGLPDLYGHLPTPRRATERAGTVLPDLARDLGLPMDVTVATGSLDLAAMMIGLGLNRPGDMVFILGTTAVFTYVMSPEPFGAPPVAATVHHPFTDDWLRVLAPQSGASAFDWFAALHPASFGGASSAEIAARINEVAADVPPGANGVQFLPFLTGERAPFVAPHARASFHGMTTATTKADLARAVMEGASLSLRHCLSSGSVPPPKQVILTGGGARNPLWRQIMADVLGTEIVVSETEDHGLWGAALLGGAAAGLLDPLSGGDRFETRRGYPPDPAAHATYSRLYEHYLAAIRASEPLWHLSGQTE